MQDFGTAIASILKSLVDKVVGLFQLLDVSFFLPGGMVLVGLALALPSATLEHLLAIPDNLLGMGILLGAYTAGLLSFSIVRTLRRWLPRGYRTLVGAKQNPTATLIRDSVESSGKLAEAHRMFAITAGADAPETAPAGPDDSNPAAGTATGPHKKDGEPPAMSAPLPPWTEPQLFQLYGRMWVLLRQQADLKPSFEHINGMWIRAAVLDGVAAALVVWAGLVYGAAPDSVLRALVPVEAVPYVIGGFVVAGVSALLEASTSREHQLYEVVSTWAWWNHPR